MNSNIFERKNFLEGNWVSVKQTNLFQMNNIDKSQLVTVNLLRATAHEADLFKHFLDKIPLKNISSVIIDLSQCNFVDSTFLSSIIKFNKENTQEIKLVISDARQLAIFKITKLDSLFRIFTNINQAIAA